MKYNMLGTSDLRVSRICLGTMTWGYQNNQQDANEQIDYSLDQGVNFIDTAEIYAIPPSAETYGKTEEILGKWLKESGRRNDVILATKMAGKGNDWIRSGAGLVKKDVKTAVEASLKRLNTDVIDLYQLHWPQRLVNSFGLRDFTDEWADEKEDYIFQILEGLKEVIAEGKIRHIGLSNETPWGIMRYIEYAKYYDMPKMQTVQNPYSLIQRQWDEHTAEVSARENVSLLAYSPLAGGILSAKYIDGQSPEGARFSTWGKERMGQYLEHRVEKSVKRYAEIAADCQITPAQLAISWVNGRSWLGANIIGATTLDQLKEVIAAEDIVLSDETINQIEQEHHRNPNPGLRPRGSLKNQEK